MPLVDITLGPEVSEGRRTQIGDAVHTALVQALGIPADDHFQIHTRASALVYDPGYLDVERGEGFLVVRVFLARGRTVAQKKALYKRLAELLEQRCDVRPADVFVNLIEVAREDFSFGCGIAQYADETPAHLAPSTAPAPEAQR